MHKNSWTPSWNLIQAISILSNILFAWTGTSICYNSEPLIIYASDLWLQYAGSKANDVSTSVVKILNKCITICELKKKCWYLYKWLLNDKKSNYNYNEFLYFCLHDKAKPNIAKLSSSSSQNWTVLVLILAYPSVRQAGRNSTFWSELDFPTKSKVVSVNV